MAGSPCSTARSRDLSLLQGGDLLRAEAELGQHLVGLLADFRRPRRHPARGARQRDRLADQADMTALGVRHVLPENWRSSRLSAAYFDADSCNTCAGSLAKKATLKWVFGVEQIRELGR